MKKPLILITIIYILIIIAAGELGILDKIPKADIARQATGINVKIQGRIISVPEEKTNRISFILDTNSINGKTVKGKVLVNIYSSEYIFSYGDIIEAEGKFLKPSSPSNPGVFDYKKYLSGKKIYSMLSVYDKKNINIIGRKTYCLEQAAFLTRRKILSVFRENLTPKQSAVISGIMLRERAGLDPYLKDIFIDAGVMHVLVVSGLHVGLISLIFFWIFRKIFRLRKKTALVFLIPAVLFYAMIAGFTPPVIRASLMTITVILSFLFSRNISIFQSIALAALIILIINPSALFGASFQMSFITTIGIIYFTPKFFRLTGKTPSVLKWPLGLACVSLSAQISILPLTAYYFNKISIIAIISNLIIPPMVFIVLIFGFAMFFSAFIYSGLLMITSKITGILISIIIFLVDLFANIQYSTITTITPPVYFMVLYYIIIAGIPKFKNYIWKRTVITAVCILFVIFAIKSLPHKRPFFITFMDVGLGDAVYCEFPNGSNMLIDGGGSWDPAVSYDIGETVVAPVILHRGRTSIDTVVLTHPHMNHYQGLTAVAKKFKIRRFITTENNSQEDEYRELMAILKKKSVPMETVKKSMHLKNGPVQIKMLNPEKIAQNADRNSLVIKMVYDDFSVLFCGDNAGNIQNILTESDIGSTFLVVPCHGKKLLSHDFLLKISPKFAIISTDKPSQKILKQLKGCKVFSTSESGAIIIETNGRTTRMFANKE
ncbi:MAG: DNA internalization-related competence protein ComEC/Rec2 [Elusimicrobia bacterium]|nr:DNA internalization-related competence protein ComEC/Rec2 [Elusimicrobiota bacterium]